MTIAGWITMIASLAFVWGLTIICFKKVLTSPKEEKAPPGFGA